MGFEEKLIDEAQKMFSSKDEVIEYIITQLDESDPKVTLPKQMVAQGE